MTLMPHGSNPAEWSGSFIDLIPIGILAGQKTMRWEVSTKVGGLLGVVKWYAHWRKYCFFPATECVFEETCLREIAQFIEDRSRNQRKGV